MLPIPRTAASAVVDYAAPLAALGCVGVMALAHRAKGAVAWRPALALLVGWAWLSPWRALAQVGWAPHRAIEVLLAPAVVSTAVLAVAAWRGIARPRWIATGLAVFAGWWVARYLVGAAEFWRVWIIVALLPVLFGRTIGAAPGPVLATGLALTGGLALAGAPAPITQAGLVLAAVGAGELALGGAAAPASLLAALIAVIDVGFGRWLGGHLGAVDLTCLAALAAPVLAAVAARRVGRASRASAALCAAAGAVGAVALVWLVHHILLA